MKQTNWFTIAALLSVFAVVIVGTFLTITTTITLDHIAALLIVSLSGVVSAILSLHLKGK